MQIDSDSFINNLFSYYDKLISPYPVSTQAAISILLLFFLAWNIYVFLKNGHWLWIIVLIAAIPATWPALKNIWHIILTIFEGIIYRIQR